MRVDLDPNQHGALEPAGQAIHAQGVDAFLAGSKECATLPVVLPTTGRNERRQILKQSALLGVFASMGYVDPEVMGW